MDEGSTSKHSGTSERHREREKDREHERHKHRDRDSDRKHKKRAKDDGDASDDGHRKHKHHKKDRDKDKSKDKDKDKDRKKKEKKDRHRSRSRERHSGSKMEIVDDDVNEAALWSDKDITMGGERILATDIPTAESLNIRSTAEAHVYRDPRLPPATSTESKLARDDWMMEPIKAPTAHQGSPMEVQDSLTEDYGDPTDGARTASGGVDFFSSLGTEKKKPPRPDRPNPDHLVISSMELNKDLKEGKPIDFDKPPPALPANTPGGPGSQWRMMRLRRVYDTAEEEGLPIEQVGIDRFGSLEAFEEAKEERRILDERDGRRQGGSNDRDRERDNRGRNDRPTQIGRDGEKKLMFSDISGGSTRSSSFRRPAGVSDSGPSTPSPAEPNRGPMNRRLDSLRLPSQANSPLAQSHTPIPSVMTPQPVSGSRVRALSPSSLNKMQAKVIRAKLMNDPNAEKLEQEYEAEARKAQGAVDDRGVRTKVEVLPTMDAHGRLYDVGHGKDDGQILPGNRKKKEKHFETHDSKTGEVLRINADDDDMTLGELLRQEKFGAGMSDQKDLDAQYAKAIMGDGKFQNDLDYIDDNAAKLGRQKMRSDAMKRQFAINDYKRTQKALSSCSFCYGEDDSLPKAAIVAMGTRVYLSCTMREELVPGHCLIVPIQHNLNTLEADDDAWDEIRNFMKCLMKMFAEEDKGVVFFETVLSIKKQQHTYIECIPVPWEQFDILPGYFKESILASEAEWSQHKKLIDFSARPGGFRRAMVPNLPYFMVQFDHKGEKGYGHVIEGAADAQDEDGLEEGEKGGGEFTRYFASEIIGNVLELETRRWRRPKQIDFRMNGDRVAGFKKKYSKFDWTGMLG